MTGVVGDTSLSPEEWGEYGRRRDCWRGCEPEGAKEGEGEIESGDCCDRDPEATGGGEGEGEVEEPEGGEGEGVGDSGGDNGRVKEDAEEEVDASSENGRDEEEPEVVGTVEKGRDEDD